MSKAKRKGEPSPVMGLSAAVMNEAIKLKCDVEGKDIFSVLGRKAKMVNGKMTEAVPMQPCASDVFKEFGDRKLYGASLRARNVPVVEAGKMLLDASKEIFKNEPPVSSMYMTTFIKQTCAKKNGGNACPL